MCALPLAELVYENNELELAAQLVEEAMSSAVGFGFVDQLISAFITRASGSMRIERPPQR